MVQFNFKVIIGGLILFVKFKMSRQALIAEESLFYVKFQREICEDVNYKDDFKYIIRERESHRMPFLHQSQQSEYRTGLINYMKKYAAKHNLSICCLHLAVYILDLFMDNHSIISNRLPLVANVCLFLAGKLEENTASMPKIQELNAAIDDVYPSEDYKMLELIILKFFNWNVQFSTAAHCIYYFLYEIVNTNDLKINKPVHTLYNELNSLIQIYLNKVIEDIHYMQFFSPSRLAAAIIFIVRTKVGLSGWNAHLENLTGYKTQDIKKPIEVLLLNNFDSCFNCKNKNNSVNYSFKKPLK